MLLPPKPGGRLIKYPRREIVNAILITLRTSAAWRMLLHDLSPYRIVFHYYRTWQQVNDALCQQTRQKQYRHPEPSAAIMDRQSVKTTEKEPRGYDRGKKVMGRKRHIAVDTGGLLLAVAVHPVDVPDRDGTRLVLKELARRFPRVRPVWADGGYRGALSGWVRQQLGCRLEIV